MKQNPQVRLFVSKQVICSWFSSYANICNILQEIRIYIENIIK